MIKYVLDRTLVRNFIPGVQSKIHCSKGWFTVDFIFWKEFLLIQIESVLHNEPLYSYSQDFLRAHTFDPVTLMQRKSWLTLAEKNFFFGCTFRIDIIHLSKFRAKYCFSQYTVVSLQGCNGCNWTHRYFEKCFCLRGAMGQHKFKLTVWLEFLSTSLPTDRFKGSFIMFLKQNKTEYHSIPRCLEP